MSQVRDLDQLLEDVVTLPSLPTTVARVTEMLDDGDAPLAEVGKVVSADPALALKTLRLVNSAHAGMRQPVSSVEQAVVLLGAKVIRNMALTASVVDNFENDATGLLRHSVCCGVVMKTLAETGYTDGTGLASEGDAFVLGLLHDIGKILMHEYLPAENAEAVELCNSRGLRLVDAERSVIGFDHAEFGARLAQHWRLDESIYAPLSAHHDFDRCPVAHQRPAALLAIADYIAYAAGYAPTTRASFPMLSADAWEMVGLDAAGIEFLLSNFFAAAREIDELLDLVE